MTTDNKTLADVQPGGRVRLGDQAERAREILAHVYCCDPSELSNDEVRAARAVMAYQAAVSKNNLDK